MLLNNVKDVMGKIMEIETINVGAKDYKVPHELTILGAGANASDVIGPRIIANALKGNK